MFALLSIGLIACLLVGILLVGLGRRGVLVGDAPTCRACGYELTGVEYAGNPCGECGVVLDAKFSVRSGRLEPRPRFMIVGGLLAVVGLVPLVTVLLFAIAGGSPASFMPTGILALSVRTIGGEDTGIELLDRLTLGVMDPEQETEVIEAVLDRQVDLGKMWFPVFGSFVEQSSMTTPEHWERYLANAFEFELVIREVVGRDSPTSVTIRYRECRLGDRKMQLWTHSRILINGEDTMFRALPDRPTVPRGLRRWNFGFDPALQNDKADGQGIEPFGENEPQNSVIRVEIAITRTPGSNANWWESHEMPDETVRWITLEQRVRLVAGDGVTRTHEGESTVDRSTHEWAESRVLCQSFKIDAESNDNSLTFYTDGLPSSLAHRFVLIYPDGSEHAICSIESMSGSRPDILARHVPIHSTNWHSNEVVSLGYVSERAIPQGTFAELRPDPAIAARLTTIVELDMRTILLGEVKNQ